MEVAREREGRRRKRRAIEAVVVDVVVIGFGILLKRRGCVLGCSFVCMCFLVFLLIIRASSFLLLLWY